MLDLGVDDITANLSLSRLELRRLNEELSELESLPENWDGEGAAAISHGVIGRTRSLLEAIINDVPGPDLIPNINGTISLEWESEGRFLHLEIGDTDFSILLGWPGEPARGVQSPGLPAKELVIQLVLLSVYDQTRGNTSITAEQLAA